MKKNTLRLLIIVCAMMVLLLALPSNAQEDWPEGCQLPDLEEALSAATAAQAEGNTVAYLDNLENIADEARDAYFRCLGVVAPGDDLVGADLTEANLQDADLGEANLQGANLTEANLHGVWLFDANLQDANLSGVDLQGANLHTSNLQDVDLTGVNLRDTWLAGANLSGADLTNADLQDAWLGPCLDAFPANLQGANLSGANLQRAQLGGANLQDADLGEANLQGANLNEANLLNANLTGALFDATTVLPDAGCTWDEGALEMCDSHWTPDTDMGRYTDPEHPDFWDVCVELDRWRRPWSCDE